METRLTKNEMRAFFFIFKLFPPAGKVKTTVDEVVPGTLTTYISRP